MGRSTEIIVALDVDTREEALHAVGICAGCDWFKVGLQLFSGTGPTFVRYLVAHKKRMFLDLKLHDIPNTVGHAAAVAAGLGVSLITVHASGGKRMIAAAREAVDGTNTRVLAVTVLTSLSESELRGELGMNETPAEAVARLASMAVDAGAHGVVASPKELEMLRRTLGEDPLIVTPGIRPSWSSQDDQARVTTPRDAARAGADFIVVGRPVLQHENPAQALQSIREELNA